VEENPDDKRNVFLKLWDKTNKKVIGKFKDELCGKVMSEIVFMRSKQYGYIEEKKESLKCKGITRAVVKNKTKFIEMKKCINPEAEFVYKDMYTLANKGHDMYKTKVNKKALAPLDDKRKISIDGIYTFPFYIESVADKIMHHGKTIKERIGF